MKELPKKKFLLVLAKTFSDNKSKLLPRHSRKFMFNWLYQSSSRTREIHGRHLNANNWIYPIHEEIVFASRQPQFRMLNIKSREI